MKSLVLSFIADDKPGLVNLISAAISEHQGNWSESSLSQLAGKFAGVVVVDVPAANLDRLTSALDSLKEQGIRVSCEVSDNQESTTEYETVTLDLVGHDKQGIVRDISNTLSLLGVNVASLETELTPGSMSSELLFKAKGELQVPKSVDLDSVQTALEEIASDLLVDITFA